MLATLLTFGKTNGYFDIKRIGDFDNAVSEGFSHINTQAIHFDKTKEKICKECKQESIKSCDALHIIPNKNRINFIEFKQIIDNSNLIRWTTGLNLAQKIKDSKEVLLLILRNPQIVHSDKVNKFNNLEKNVIISFDVLTSSKNKIYVYIKYFQVKQLIIKELKNIIPVENFNNPECIKTNEFDIEYPRRFL